MAVEQASAGGDAGREPAANGALATLATRGFVGRPAPTIAAATAAGLFAMSISFAFEPPILVPMVALVAGILLVLGFRAGDMRYRLTADGLHRSFRPLAAGVFGLAGREQSFGFDAMRFYRRDRDWSRYRAEEIETLTIGLRRPPFRIAIHDMMGKAAFDAFADRFEELAAGREAAGAGAIERRPGFYQSIWAKLITVVFAIAAVGLTIAFFAGLLSPTGVFRLLIVIIPGVIYMGWRVLNARKP